MENLFYSHTMAQINQVKIVRSNSSNVTVLVNIRSDVIFRVKV